MAAAVQRGEEMGTRSDHLESSVHLTGGGLLEPNDGVFLRT
jgi:hypothetical protein